MNIIDINKKLMIKIMLAFLLIATPVLSFATEPAAKHASKTTHHIKMIPKKAALKTHRPLHKKHVQAHEHVQTPKRKHSRFQTYPHAIHKKASSYKKPAIEDDEYAAENLSMRSDDMQLVNTALPTIESTKYNLPEAYPEKIQGLLAYATSLVGTNYRYAGESPITGFDCSGYVEHVYKHELGITLPHNAAAISKITDKISKLELRPGDLVLFNTLRRAFSHIGIYLGNHRFIHASGRSGTRSGIVKVSDLRSRYWAKRFSGARRLELNNVNYNYDYSSQ